MGAYRRDLDFLVGALQNGLDPMSGMNMYQGFQADRAARQQAKQEAMLAQQQMIAEAQAGQRDFLGELSASAIERAREGTPMDALLPELQVQMQVAGIKPKMMDEYLGAAGLETLYPGGGGVSPLAPADSIFDDDDAKAVWSQAATLAQQGLGRADARGQISSAIRTTLGDAAFSTIKPMLDQAIDKAYAGIPLG